MQNLNNIQAIIHYMNCILLPKLEKKVAHDVGDYKWSCRTEDYNDWVLCDGRELLKADYPELAEVVGNAFGETENPETFLLPDFRSKVMGAIGQGIGLTMRELGQALGAETHTLSVNELPSHNHTATTAVDGVHSHGGKTVQDGLHTHATNATGGSLGLALADGNNTVIDTDGSAGELNVWTTPRALVVNDDGAHTHDIPQDNGHTHAVTVNNTGNGDAHNIMQPTLFAGSVFIYAGMRSAVQGTPYY